WTLYSGQGSTAAVLAVIFEISPGGTPTVITVSLQLTSYHYSSPPNQVVPSAVPLDYKGSFRALDVGYNEECFNPPQLSDLAEIIFLPYILWMVEESSSLICATGCFLPSTRAGFNFDFLP
ncbi:hypothetical protein HAX54_039197, partial [Datura stramonium]|nr:hypothetical protein [Datura stramonium]